jgi:hypothetical protein
MDHSERYRAAERRLIERVREALADVAPEVAVSTVGRIVLAAALVNEAVRLVRGDADEAVAREVVAHLASIPLPSGQRRGSG